MAFSKLIKYAAACLLVQSFAVAAPASNLQTLQPRQATDKLVFAHFMIGIVSDRIGPQDFDDDMKRAKAIGIDAFALNIGVDPYTDQQLGYAYQSAANNGMNVFISFDFNWWSTGQATQIGQKIAQYASLPAQLKIGSAAFVSSFAGDGLDVAAMRSAAGIDLFFAPNFHPGNNDFSNIDGALSWQAWDENGNNKAPSPGSPNITTSESDASYVSALGSKAYIAPAAAWFSTHYGPEVSYSKNFVFPSDLLWYNRWNEILALAPQYVEIVTWNDYGESHYIGPLSSKHYDDGSSKWANDMPHDGWLDLAIPFISAFKASAKSVDPYIGTEQIIYWYRQNLKSLDCDATDTCMVSAPNSSGNYFIGKPNGYDSMADSVFVVTLLKEAGTLVVNSGSNTQSLQAPAGAASFEVNMGLGQQSFILERNGAAVQGLEGASLKDITDVCNCGIYNFNAYVGTLPSSTPDPMGPDGLNSLTSGLHVSTCSATPSLPTFAAAITATNVPGKTVTSPNSPTTITPTTGPTTTAKPTTTAPTVTTPATTTAKVTGSCVSMITASSQIFPTNCLAPGECWAGPTGQATPDRCDGH